MRPSRTDVMESTDAPASKPVILIADNLFGSVSPLYKILKPSYNLMVALSGEETLQFCRTIAPDLLVLADSLKDITSFEVLRQLKKHSATAGIRVLYVAGDGEPMEEIRAFEAGADDFLARSFHSEVLKARVRRQAEFKAQTDLLQSFATTDALTGLANRRRFEEALDQEWRRAVRDKVSLCLLMLNVDRFKAFNDLYGYPFGDKCLKAVSEALKPIARRPGDIVARYGGEEFVVLLPGATEAYAIESAKHSLAMIRACAIPHLGNPGPGCIVTASVGVASIPPPINQKGREALVAAADQMLYEAKRGGRDRVMSLSLMLVDPKAPIPPDEIRRIASVEAFKAAQGHERPAYLDDIAQLAATLLGTPIGLVSLVGRDNQSFVGRYGLDAEGTSRDVSFCAHVLNGDSPLVVPNATEDPRFKNNILVTGEMNIRFYAGAPLISTDDGTRLGALCVIDKVPRKALAPEQSAQLSILAKLAIAYIDQLTGSARALWQN